MNRYTYSTLLIPFIFIINNAWSHGVSNTASTFIISPANEAKVYNPVTVKFGIKNFKIGPAGQDIHKSGHYHLIIDQKNELSIIDPIPYDKNHRHLDDGESEITLSLTPGKHTLQLVVGDEEHEPFEELVSKKIVIEVISDKQLDVPSATTIQTQKIDK